MTNTTTEALAALAELHDIASVEDPNGAADMSGTWTFNGQIVYAGYQGEIINDYDLDSLDLPGMGYRGPIITA